jgi:hypothetical protein
MDRVFLAQAFPDWMRIAGDKEGWIGKRLVNVHIQLTNLACNSGIVWGRAFGGLNSDSCFTSPIRIRRHLPLWMLQ